MRLAQALVLAVSLVALSGAETAKADDCVFRSCAPSPDVTAGDGELVAAAFEVRGATGYASASVDTGAPTYSFRLRTQCQVTDVDVGGCSSDAVTCDQTEGRAISYYVVQRQRLVQPDGSAVDGQEPPAGQEAGTGYGAFETTFAGCVDVTDLNPPPSPAEVFRYFQTLPLPQLTTRQQPPGEALVGLPVIFFTDSPTTQTFTVDIRGFDVLITANAVSYTWRTGDGTTLTTTDPGAPYPDHTISHEYSSGTYTASLTTTWGATYSVDGGVSADVPGTTTTDGAPATFTVLQARSVLTSPYD
ncbi:hypothetical protein [Modestobacter marinus]|uniref:PKD domain-containing protein n=1 Tax=Modestobacter marinus TaxID=477641 RepID=A0A846LGF5_9ACTN|nr:hypothetical protein [Modestobacter marinus]NIH66321.1 hypothetical protein [Modestobacter marinus]